MLHRLLILTVASIYGAMQIETEFSPEDFMPEDSDSMEAVIDDAHILIYDKKISSAQDLVPILEKLIQTGNAVLDPSSPGPSGRSSS